jgi:hypothetical protein
MTLKKIEKFRSILNNEDNGNVSHFRRAIKKLTKLEMLELIEYASGQRGIKRHITINKMRGALEM